MARARRLALIAAAAALAAGSLAAAGCGGDDDSGAAASDTSSGAASGSSVSGQIAGAGSSAQEAAQEAWIAGFQTANPGATVTYDPVGSGGGREQFVAGGDRLRRQRLRPRRRPSSPAPRSAAAAPTPVEVPVYVSPIAIVYNLDGRRRPAARRRTRSRKIFTRKITKWNDPAIAADNPDADLPDTAITPVHRSDESGTTENFTDYLAQVAPDAWTYEPAGDWPVKGGEAAQGTSGVVDAVERRRGHDRLRRREPGRRPRRRQDQGRRRVRRADRRGAPPRSSTCRPGRATTRASTSSPTTSNATRPRQGVYPIVLVSYVMACTTVRRRPTRPRSSRRYLNYIISAEGQRRPPRRTPARRRSRTSLRTQDPAGRRRASAADPPVTVSGLRARGARRRRSPRPTDVNPRDDAGHPAPDRRPPGQGRQPARRPALLRRRARRRPADPGRSSPASRSSSIVEGVAGPHRRRVGDPRRRRPARHYIGPLAFGTVLSRRRSRSLIAVPLAVAVVAVHHLLRPAAARPARWATSSTCSRRSPASSTGSGASRCSAPRRSTSRSG